MTGGTLVNDGCCGAGEVVALGAAAAPEPEPAEAGLAACVCAEGEHQGVARTTVTVLPRTPVSVLVADLDRARDTGATAAGGPPVRVTPCVFVATPVALMLNTAVAVHA